MCCRNVRAQAGHEPHADCPDGRRNFKPDAWLVVERFGLDPCRITGTGRGGLVLRQDVERAMER